METGPNVEPCHLDGYDASQLVLLHLLTSFPSSTVLPPSPSRLSYKCNPSRRSVEYLQFTDLSTLPKFVVDGIWTTDSSGREEFDENSNINNVLSPEDILSQSSTKLENGLPAMAGVTPDSTTAALAAQVPKESNTPDGIISSAAPDSTSAELAKQSLQEREGNLPGAFPQTPQRDSGEFSVNPIPASSGFGNPIQLRPGEKVPDPSAVNENTVGSTVRTDRAAYDADASTHFPSRKNAPAENDLTLPTESKSFIPESGLPMGQENPDPGYTIHSVGPPSTTAALAAGVPLESEKKGSQPEPPHHPVGEVPSVVRKSIAEAHEEPEAAAIHHSVEEKKELERELQNKVQVNESAGAPAPTVTAATTETAPRPTGGQDSGQVSPRSPSPTQPIVTTGAAEAKAPVESGPGTDRAPTGATVTTGPTPSRVVDSSTTAGAGTTAALGASAAGATTQGSTTQESTTGSGNTGTNGDSKKRRSRTSEWFNKLRDKFR